MYSNGCGRETVVSYFNTPGIPARFSGHISNKCLGQLVWYVVEKESEYGSLICCHYRNRIVKFYLLEADHVFKLAVFWWNNRWPT
jgi:hypothetical protein